MKRIVSFVLCILAISPASIFAEPLEIAGYTFPDGEQGFVDTAVHVSGPEVGQLEDVVGWDLNTAIAHWAGDGLVSQVDLYFSNNLAANHPGTDLVVYELNGILASESSSLSIHHNNRFTDSIEFLPEYTGFQTESGTYVHAAEIDLEVFGLGEGDSVSLVRLYLTDWGGAGSADIAAVGSLHDSPESLQVAGYAFVDGEQAFVDVAVHVSGPDVGPITDVTGSDISTVIAHWEGDGLVSEIDLYFSDNTVVNHSGADLIAYEIGGVAEGERFSISIYKDNEFTSPIEFLPQYTGFQTQSGAYVNAAEIELSDFGVYEGDSVNLARLYLTDWGGAGSADVAAVGSLHNMETGLVAHWSFDEGSGSSLSDSSGNSNHGAIYGATWSNGIEGNALHFDGIDDYIEVPDDHALDIIGQLSITAWLKPNPSAQGTFVVYKCGNTYDEPYKLGLGADMHPGFRINNDPVFSADSILFDQWTFVAGVYDGTSKKIYINGDQVAYESHITSIKKSDMNLYIGADRDGVSDFNQFFVGSIDELRIYNRALSQIEIEFLYQYPGGNVLTIDEPISLWGNISQYDAIYVINGGSITVPNAIWNNNTWEGGYLMLEADHIYVDASSSIHADACGFSKEDGHSGGGPGKGTDYVHDDFTALQSADGAGHGGRGGHYLTTIGSGGPPYGTASADDTHVDSLFGSSGGDYAWLELGPDAVRRGGRGGGYIRLRGNTVIVEGTITANGGNGLLMGLQPPGAGSGGGSGGQIVFDSPNLTVTGTVEARGGNGSDPSALYSSGGGAGGRIKTLQSSSGTCGSTFSASGGGGCGGMGKGDPGTIYFAGQPSSSVPTSIDLQSEDDTGRDNTDYLTNLPGPRIVGQAAANAQINIYEGSSIVGSGQSDGSGGFEVQVGLSDGPHTLTATAQEVCHGESAQSTTSVSLTVDTQKPTTPAMPDMVEDLFYGGQSLTDNITSDASPTFEGTVDPDCEWVLLVDSVEEKRRVTTDGSWHWTINPRPEGSHQIAVKAIDKAGNGSDLSAALSVSLDLTDPVITNMQATPTDCQLNGTIFTIQANVTDAMSGVWTARGVDCDIRFAGQSRVAGVELDHQGGSLFSGTWDSTGAAAGTYTIDFEAADIAGNKSEIAAGAAICIEAPTPYCGDASHPYPDADINKNCYVNLADFILLENRWLDTPCTTGNGWCDGLDLSENGTVDLEDVAILADCWLECTDPLAPCEYLP